MRRPHRVARDRDELAFEHVYVDVVTQAPRTAPQWLEECHDAERRPGNGDRAAGYENRQQELERGAPVTRGASAGHYDPRVGCARGGASGVPVWRTFDRGRSQTE